LVLAIALVGVALQSFYAQQVPTNVVTVDAASTASAPNGSRWPNVLNQLQPAILHPFANQQSLGKNEGCG